MGVGYCGGGGAECSSSSVATGATEENELQAAQGGDRGAPAVRAAGGGARGEGEAQGG
jgi:hypothetical protein